MLFEGNTANNPSVLNQGSMTGCWSNRIYTISDRLSNVEREVLFQVTSSIPALDKDLFFQCCEVALEVTAPIFWVPCTVLCITAFSLRRSVSGRTLATLTVGYFIVRLYLSISCFLCMFYLCQCWITSHFWSCNHLPNKNAVLRGLKGWHRAHRFLAGSSSTSV